MSPFGSKKSAQFAYWNLKRKGLGQSEIARQYGITRQSVSKSIKLMERDILYQMLEFCRTSGVLVEWTDAAKGATIGIIAQLERMASLLMVDGSGKMRMFYDTDRISDRGERERQMSELQNILKETLGIEIGSKDPFKEIIGKIIAGDQ